MRICGQNQPSDAESIEISVSLTSQHFAAIIDCNIMSDFEIILELTLISNLFENDFIQHCISEFYYIVSEKNESTYFFAVCLSNINRLQ